MELRRSEHDGLKQLAALWATTKGAEMEAMLTNLDLTSWQDIIQYLRSLGMREAPQIVRLNVCLTNDIRFTLEGAGVIQAYCRDNRMADKPFTAMLKESIGGAVPVDFTSYAARAKLKRELPLSPDDAQVKEALGRWAQLTKLFRQIQRFEFVAPGGLGIRFDVSVVREGRGRTYQEARMTMAASRYEAEVEVTADRSRTAPPAAAALLTKGLSWLLQGRQRSYVLVSSAGAGSVIATLSGIFSGGANSRNRNRGTAFRYPGPQPASLERRNMSVPAETGVPNLQTMPGGYNVTDKADGLRCLLYVAENGKLFLVDGGGRVYATGCQVKPAELAGTVLDGEWIRKDRKGASVSRYYAFDILAMRGDTTVTQLPFMIPDVMMGAAVSEKTRQAVMASAVSILSDAEQTVRGIPAGAALQVNMKRFRTAANIFRDAAASVLEEAASAPYNTDGLIFTPNAAPLPLGRGTWSEQLKWKPPMENTIDFLVVVEKERDAAGAPTGAEAIETRFREDSGQTVRYKTLRLFVGSSRDAAFADPRSTVLGKEPLPTSVEDGAWRPVEFRPTEPRDPMASVCYVEIGAGSNDPAGATAGATMLDTNSDVIKTARSGDLLQSDMIVEMAYHPDRAPGWRWEPTRVRHDKTERWAAGAKSGTMNADWVAAAIWSSLHNPVTEHAIRTGKITECAAPEAAVAPSSYYNRRAPTRDLMKVQCLRNFHNNYVKRRLLLQPTLRAGARLCDLAMGKAGDLHKWINADVGYVFGCDVAAANLNDPEDGAYRRLLDKMVALGGRDRVPPMVFVQADAARPLRSGAAGVTPEDQAMLQSVFEGDGAGPSFDVASCMFALHYMFRDENTLAGFLTNLADTIKVGGYFVGCGFDGDSVARLLAGSATAIGKDGETDVWLLTKRYGSDIGAAVPTTAAGLGLAISVDFISIGETHTEYLVSWSYLQTMLETVGLELLTAGECAEMGLPASSQMFSEAAAAAAASGEAYDMTDAVRRFSFLNRWYIFKRRSDRRPAPPLAMPSAPVGLTEFVSERKDDDGPGSVPGPGPGPGDVIDLPASGAPPIDVIEMPDAPAPAVAAADVIDLPSAAGAGAGAGAVAATAPAGPYIVNSNGASDMRLGTDLRDWPSYMSLSTLVEIPDKDDPAIKYPSMEAAICSAKYLVATGTPALGRTLFSVDSVIHKKFEAERVRIGSATTESVNNEAATMRTQTGESKMKKYPAWASWSSQREAIYKTYLGIRYTVDPRFKAMVKAIVAGGGEILFANGTAPSELGVGVLPDGSVVGGDNRVGKWMMELGS